MLLVITLLGALVYAPGNPLTEFPPEIRAFLKQGLSVTYAINSVLAVQAFFNAKSKNLPALFWAVKTFLLGGVAYFEITQARDPSEINDARPDLSDRKSKNRTPTV
jgi:RsiW-degrading membrane proteinase PrsW (M82 family)